MEGLPDITIAALKFEQSNWSSGSVTDDEFYTVPIEAANAIPGALLKSELETDLSKYTLPPSTSLSRILFQSKSLLGTSVPSSAYVLWPYAPRKQVDGYQVVVWAHGTSGVNSDSAPSNMKNLWQHFQAPYLLALHGYVVVAPDYAGLGVGKTALGEPIIHEYLASPSQANDLLYSVLAAQKAFPELSNQFVVLGHSQGGGACWAFAQLNAVQPIDGYLGSIAVAPITTISEQNDPFRAMLTVATFRVLQSIFPEFKPEDILTADGAQRVDLMQRIGGNTASGMSLLMGVELLKPDWTQNAFVKKFESLVSNGGKNIEGPLLVIHGEADPLLSSAATIAAVDKTAELFPSAQIQHISLPGVTHVPALFASQRIWMDWIADRFAGKKVDRHLQRSVVSSARPVVQSELNWFIEPATQFFQTP